MLLIKDKYEEEFAIKLINKKTDPKGPYLEECIEGKRVQYESLKRHYIMRLIDFSKGEKYMVYSAGMVAASSTIRPSSKTKFSPPRKRSRYWRKSSRGWSCFIRAATYTGHQASEYLNKI